MRLEITSILLLVVTFSYGQEIKYGFFCRQNSVGDHSVKTAIILNADQTFEYEFTGHMVHNVAKGTFSVSKNNIIKLRYYKLDVKDQNYEQVIEMVPKVMKYEADRLYEIDEKGKAIKTKRLLSRHRRFYFFGNYSRRRPIFLERVNDITTCK